MESNDCKSLRIASLLHEYEKEKLQAIPAPEKVAERKVLVEYLYESTKIPHSNFFSINWK